MTGICPADFIQWKVKMNITQIQSQIKEYSDKIENTFLSLADRFPALMNKEDSSAMDRLLKMFDVLAEQNADSTKKESTILSDCKGKYQPLFEKLNVKIDELSNVNEQVKQIKDYSEEMELIALNAMVISIKSGEKGRAFSSITDNLKQLSTDMNIFSNKLLEEEEMLLQYIKSLQTIFDNIMTSQESLSEKGATSTSNIQELIVKASAPLTQIRSIIESVYTPIQKTMEGLQMQDIIRQALDHVILCMKECSNVSDNAAEDEKTLDEITFNIALMKLSKSVLDDIRQHLSKSISIFQNNWQSVSHILDQVEPKRNDYIYHFLDRNAGSPDNILDNMDSISRNFTELLSMFAIYQSNQKDLEKNCNNITDKAHTMYSVFETIKPVVDRLHHVRILQQIEVAKNPAISAVKDSVTDMDNLISAANIALDKIQDLLSSFIKQIKELLDSFTKAINSDNLQMNQLKSSKNAFFTEFRATQDNLASILSGFSVFPAGFEQQCENVKNELSILENINSAFSQLSSMLENEYGELENRKAQLMPKLGVRNWDIQNDRFRQLIEHFTITAHKQAAGELGHLGIEKGSPSGEITMF